MDGQFRRCLAMSISWRQVKELSRGGSRAHCCSFVEGGARLCPCGIAPGTPQAFPVASPIGDPVRFGKLPTATLAEGKHRLQALIYQAQARNPLRGLWHWGPACARLKRRTSSAALLAEYRQGVAGG